MQNAYKYLLLIVVLVIVLVISAFVFSKMTGGGIFKYGWRNSLIPNTLNKSEKSQEEIFSNLFNNGKFKELNGELDYRLLNNPNDINLLLLKAQTLSQEASLTFKEKELGDQARLIANKVLALDPKNVGALEVIGYTYEIQENYTEAHKYYDKALSIDENSFSTLTQKGHAYDLQGDLEKAEDYYNKALKINADYVKAKTNLIRVYVLNGESDKARDLINKTVSQMENINTKASLYYALGTTYENITQYNKNAEENYKKAIETDPSFPLAYVGLAKEQFKNGQISESFTTLETALKLNPNQTNAMMQLALQFIALQQFDSAKAVLSKTMTKIDSDLSLNPQGREMMKMAVAELLKTIKK